MKWKNFFLAALMVACGKADLSTEPPPAPTKGTLEFATIPANVPGAMCTGENASGTTTVGPLAPKAKSDSLPAGQRVVPKCTAPNHKPGEGVPDEVEAGQHIVLVVPLEKIVVAPPPLDSNAVIRIESKDGTTVWQVVTRVKVPLTGAAVTTQINQPTSYQETVKVDGSAYKYLISKPGFSSKWYEVEPIPRQVNLLLVSLTSLPPVVSDSGMLSCASAPSGMKCTIYRLGTTTQVVSGTTDFQVKLKSGSYTALCEDPTGKRVSDSESGFLPAGGELVLNCENPEKPVPPPPPPPPPPPQMCEAVVSFGSWKYVAAVDGEVNLLRNHTAVNPGFEGPVEVRLMFISFKSDKTDRFVVSRRNPLTGATVDRTALSADAPGVNGIVEMTMGSFASWSDLYDIFLENKVSDLPNPPQPRNIGEVEGMKLKGKRRC